LAIQNKKSIAVFVGGAGESIYSGIGRADLIIRRRRGIFEMALKNGVSLVPTFTFGENDIFKSYNIDFLGIFAFLQKCIGICCPRGIPIFMNPKFITIIGKPINVTRRENGEYTEADVIKLREKYISELEILFNKYKHLDKNYKDTTMRIMA
jgi:hypothetical protein